MINGISHITFIVKDLNRSSHFFKTVFHAKEIYSSGKNNFSLSKEKFLLLKDVWIAIMEGDPPPKKHTTILHFLFQKMGLWGLEKLALLCRFQCRGK